MEGVRLVISSEVVKKFSNVQTSGEFVKVCINFSPVDVSGAGTKAESSGEELSFVIHTFSSNVTNISTPLTKLAENA